MTSRRVLAALLAAAVASVGLAAGPVAAPPAEAAAGPASLVVAPDDGGVVQDGKDLGVTVAVTNTGTAELPSGRVSLAVDAAPAASTTSLLTSISTRPEALQGKLLRAQASVQPLAVGATSTVHLTEQGDDLAGILTALSGARTLYVQYAAGRSGSVARVFAQSVIVKMTGSKAAVGLAAVIPLVAPRNSTGVVDVATQTSLVASDGAWGIALRAARADPAAAVALDPEVLASIRLAGDAAPPAVSGFLDALRGLPNEFLRLPYADTDLTLARAAGAPSSLEPTSFADVAPERTATTGPTPAPSTPAATTSSAAALTAWTWSDRRIAWPVPGTTSRADLGAFGSSSVLLSSDDLVDTATRRASGPLARIGSTDVLVVDPTVSSLMSAAGGSGVDADAALAELTGLLATSAVNGETSALLAAVGRGTDAARLPEVLRRLGEQPWVRPTTLSGLRAASAATGVQARSGAVPRSEAATARTLVDGEHDVQELGRAIVAGAPTVTAPQRLALLASLSAAWRADPDGWRSAATAAAAGFQGVMDQVKLAKGSDPNFIGSDGKLRVYVSNDLAVPVRVEVHGSVSNGAVQFTQRSVQVIVPAQGSARGILPFRSIRNGRTDLTLSLTTPDGTAIGSRTNRGATVSAGFDTIVAVGLLSALAVLLAVGVYRNIKRRRQPRTATA
ncbi:DUF6049 family protein [Amnibacterium kyonggiense]